MLFKDIFLSKVWWPLCLVEQEHCAILVEGIIWNNSVKSF